MKLPVADAHCDTLYSIAIGKHAPDTCTVQKARLEKGNVALQTFAMFAGGEGPKGHPYQKALDMLAAADSVGVPMLRAKLPDTLPDTPHGIFSLEGGEILEGSLDRLAEFDDACRIRMIALTWNHENEIGHPAAQCDDQGLKPFGIELLKEMDARGIMADVSHLNIAGFWDCIEYATLPVVATHSNLRTLCDVKRNLYPDQVQAIIDKNGFIGINFYSNFLSQDGNATLDVVLRHIDGIAEMGGIDVLGFGSDFDGIESWPEGLANPEDFQCLLELLSKHGYTNDQLRKIAGENLFRVLKQAESERIR